MITQDLIHQTIILVGAYEKMSTVAQMNADEDIREYAEKLARMLKLDLLFFQKLLNDMGPDSLLGMLVLEAAKERDRIAGEK